MFLINQKLRLIQQEIEGQDQRIFLECPNLECEYGPEVISMTMKLKDYVPGKLGCQKCGNTLETEEDRNIAKMLLDLGINSSGDKTNY